MQDYFNDQQQEEPIPMLESSEWRENWHANMVRLVEWSCSLQLLANSCSGLEFHKISVDVHSDCELTVDEGCACLCPVIKVLQQRLTGSYRKCTVLIVAAEILSSIILYVYKRPVQLLDVFISWYLVSCRALFCYCPWKHISFACHLQWFVKWLLTFEHWLFHICFPSFHLNQEKLEHLRWKTAGQLYQAFVAPVGAPPRRGE